MEKQFDSDTGALRQRLQVNVAGATHNLEDWIIEQVQPHSGMRVLDLGCGTGKQSFAVAEIVTPKGEVLGVDISEDAVKQFNERAGKEHVFQAKAIKGSLDESLELLKPLRFDLILSTYAIYYAKHMVQLVSGLRTLLQPNGQVFICGPGKGTNQEILQLIGRLVQAPSPIPIPMEDFVSPEDIQKISRHYRKFETVRLQNQIRFDSVERILNWWENHNSFLPGIRNQVAKALQAHFDKHQNYILTKNVLGVHLYAE
ncbi:MAG TPA: class I SAM-dependent methyltransferase [Candidatus Sulfotelmatobacter sp.]|nr:class I SAM-dependent methyltransferase [Candidatus Sulfotelmatobacter sp.]